MITPEAIERTNGAAEPETAPGEPLPMNLTLTEDERAELAEVFPAIQAAHSQYVAPLESAVQAILRVAERRLGMPRGSFGRKYGFNLQTGEIVPLEAPGATS
jgi:hypothetical protein